MILYTHPLLGEGLATLLAPEPGIVVTCAPARDPEAVRKALAGRPDAVIFEWNDIVRQADLPTTVPGAVLIDASMDLARGPAVTADPPGPDDVLSTLRGIRCTARRNVDGAVETAAVAGTTTSRGVRQRC